MGRTIRGKGLEILNEKVYGKPFANEEEIER